LVMGFLRQQAGQQLGALNDTRPLLEYTGIKSDAPIAVASWAAAGATPTISAARRQGMVLRIKNRQQFERFVAQYQRSIGAFSDLPHYIGVVVRMMPALPAFLPFTA